MQLAQTLFSEKYLKKIDLSGNQLKAHDLSVLAK